MRLKLCLQLSYSTVTGGRRREKAKEQWKEELPEAPWAGAWQMLRRRSCRWRMVQRSGEAEGAAWEEGQSEGSPECSCGSVRPPEMRGIFRGKKEMG